MTLHYLWFCGRDSIAVALNIAKCNNQHILTCLNLPIVIDNICVG